MKKIIFATGNQDKMREIREILADMDVLLQSFPAKRKIRSATEEKHYVP